MADEPRSRLPSFRTLAVVLAWAAVGVLGLVLFFTLTGDSSSGPTAEDEARADSVAGPSMTRPTPGARPDEPKPLVDAEVARLEMRVRAALDDLPVDDTPVRRDLLVNARGITWLDRQGRPFLRAAGATGLLDPSSFGGGPTVLRSVVAERPNVLVVQSAEGADFNYVPLFGLDESAADRRARRAGAEEGGGIYVQGLTIRNGRAEVRRPGDDVILEEVAGRLSRVALPPGERPPQVDVAELTAALVLPDRDARLALRAEEGVLVFPEGLVEFDIESLRLDETRLADVEGVWNPELPVPGLRAVGRAESLRLADFQFLGPRVPDDGVASFTFDVAPVDGRTRVELLDLRFESGESVVTGRLVATADVEAASFQLGRVDLRLEPLQVALIERLTGRDLPYSGTLRGTVEGPAEALEFALDARLRAEGVEDPIVTRITGLAGLTDIGFELRRLTADLDDVPLAALRALQPNLPLSGVIRGTVTLRGLPGDTPLDLDVRFDIAGGTAVVEGTVDLTGAVPTYDVEGRLLSIDLQSLIEPDFPPVTFSGGFTAAGRGTDPATLQADVALSGRFAGWYTEPEDTVSLRASVDAGVLRLDRATAVLATAAAAAEGSWALREGAAAEGIRYRLVVSSLGPFGPYLPQADDDVAGGSVDVAGLLSGSLQRPQLEGELALAGVRVGSWAVRAAEARYTLELGDTIPTVLLEAGGRGIETPSFGAFEAVSVNLSVDRPTFSLVARADRVDAGVVELEADGSFLAGGQREAVVRRFVAELEDQAWALAQPALVRWGGVPGIAVEELVLRSADGAGRVAIDGVVFPLAHADLRFDVAALPIADVQRLLGREPLLTGVASASGVLSGGDDPELDAEFRVDAGSIRDVPFSILEGRVQYAGLAAVTRASLLLSPSGRVDVDARLPIDLVLGDSIGFDWIEGGTLEGTVASDSLPIAVLAEMMPAVREPEGFLTGSVELGGTPADPDFAGELRLVNGAVTVPELRRRFERINGRLVLRDETVEVVSAEAWSGGRATASGTVVFEELTEPVVDLAVELDQFRPMGVSNQKGAAVYGQLTLTGPLDALVLGGDVDVADGYLEVPAFGTDPFRAEVEEFIATGGAATAGLGGTEGGMMRNLAIRNLRIDFREDVWFIMEEVEARAFLRGELTVFKEGEAIRIFGTLQGDRGTFTLEAGPVIRRFEIVAAEIRFFGTPDPNPAINITAARTMYTPEGQQMEILANVVGTARRPRLSLATAQGVNIPESELLSFLLFGRPSFEIGGGLAGTGGALVSGTIFGGLADLASMELEEALVEELGLPLDMLQVRFPSQAASSDILSGLSTPTVVVGKEIGSDVFITVESAIATLFGDAGRSTLGVSVEWRIDREWTLEAGIEPVIQRRLNRLGIQLLTPLTAPVYQTTIDLRRRWTY